MNGVNMAVSPQNIKMMFCGELSKVSLDMLCSVTMVTVVTVNLRPAYP